MADEPNPGFSWREIGEFQARVENPSLRQPLSLIIDDPTPGYNPAYFHSGFLNGPMHVPASLIDDVADLIEETGIRGKFSVIPMPFGLGRLDGQIEGVEPADVRHFLDVVRARIAPYLDITPEALTHWNAVDLATGRLLPLWEHVWSRQQTRQTLHPYLSLALEIVNAAGLPSTGMTSPWDFGDGVETEYAEAILSAQRAVNGRTLTWYFLQMDGASKHVPPKLTVFRPEAGEVVVSIITCDTYDFGRGVWRGGEPDPDLLISADGQSGRLAQVLSAGGPAAFHTHWQTLFSQGRSAGRDAIATVAQRVRDRFHDGVIWTRTLDLATYAAAAAALHIAPDDAGSPSVDTDHGTVVMRLTTPFACKQFTMSLATNQPIKAVRLDGKPLTRIESARFLDENTFLVAGDRVYICWSLRTSQQLQLELA